MKKIKTLWTFMGGGIVEDEDQGPAQYTRHLLLAIAVASLFSIVFGVALSGLQMPQLLSNTVLTPLTIVFSGLFALPPAIITWRIAGLKGRASILVSAMVAGTLATATWLASISPVILLYGQTTNWLGPVVSIGGSIIGVTLGLAVVFRAIKSRLKGSSSFASMFIPVGVMVACHFAILTQLITTSNLLPETTWLDRGLEGAAERAQ